MKAFRKFMLWGCLTPIILLSISVGIAILLFTPIIEFDDDLQKIALFNRTIVLDTLNSTLMVNDDFIHLNSSPHSFSGQEDLSQSDITTLEASFAQAGVKIQTASDSTLKWDCKIGLQTNDSLIKTENKILKIDLTGSPYSHCDFFIPEGMKVIINGNNLNSRILQPKFDLTMNFTQALIKMKPDPMSHYQFNFQITQSDLDTFYSSASGSAFKMNFNGTQATISAL